MMNETEAMNQEHDPGKREQRGEERQIVVFSIGSEEFGVNIGEVREIIRAGSYTRIPNTPAYVRGVINLRGSIVVVIDLAMRLSLGGKESENTRIIVIENNGNTLGMLVDSATEVMRLTTDQIHPPPPIITDKINAGYIEGVGIVGERLLILLDLAKILDGQEIAALGKQASSAHPVSHRASPVSPSSPPSASPSSSASHAPSASPTSSASKQAVSSSSTAKSSSDASGPKQQKGQQEAETSDKVAGSEAGADDAGNPQGIITVGVKAADHPVMKDVHHEWHFITHDGKPLKNVGELLSYVHKLDGGTFKAFVNEEKNDFANWIGGAVGDKELADRVRAVSSKEEVTKEIRDRILEIHLGG